MTSWDMTTYGEKKCKAPGCPKITAPGADLCADHAAATQKAEAHLAALDKRYAGHMEKWSAALNTLRDAEKLGDPALVSECATRFAVEDDALGCIMEACCDAERAYDQGEHVWPE